MTQSFWRPHWFEYPWTHSNDIIALSHLLALCVAHHTLKLPHWILPWILPANCLPQTTLYFVCETWVDKSIFVWLTPWIMAEESSVRQRAPAFKLEIPGDNNVKDAIRHKLVSAKKILSTKLNRMANNADALNAVLDAWLKSETANENALQEHGSESQTSHPQPELVQIQIATRDQAKQPQYVTCKTSLEKLLEISHYHGKSCQPTVRFWERVAIPL